MMPYDLFKTTPLFISLPGIILCMCLANEKRRYNVTSSLIGLTHTQNDPCTADVPTENSFIIIPIFIK